MGKIVGSASTDGHTPCTSHRLTPHLLSSILTLSPIPAGKVCNPGDYQTQRSCSDRTVHRMTLFQNITRLFTLQMELHLSAIDTCFSVDDNFYFHITEQSPTSVQITESIAHIDKVPTPARTSFTFSTSCNRVVLYTIKCLNTPTKRDRQ